MKKKKEDKILTKETEILILTIQQVYDNSRSSCGKPSQLFAYGTPIQNYYANELSLKLTIHSFEY